MSVAKTIDTYFSNAKEAIETYDEYLHRLRTLDFTKMRGFLRTTFNTLQEIDPDFLSSNLIKMSKKMNTMAEISDDFFAKSKMGMYSYERIFLHRQMGFSASEGRLGHNTDELTYLRALMKEMATAIKLQKETLEKLSKNSVNYDKEEMELKRLKRRENNVLTRYGQLIDENGVLAEVIVEFKERHHEEFMRRFSEYINEVKPKLKVILDAMAFEFEIVLWHKARESLIIREFFKTANSGEVVSSKTYLQYFLRSLDETKLTKENQELQELFQYLSRIRVIKVLLAIPNKDDLEGFEAALVSDASGFEIFSCEDARCALTKLLTESIDILVLDTEIGLEALEELVKQYRVSVKKRQKPAKVILMAGEINERTIASAQQLKVDSLIEREIEPIEIIDTVYMLLNK